MRTDAYFLGERNTRLNTNVAAQKQIEKSVVWTAIGKLVQLLFTHAANSADPQISHKRDRQGRLIWYVYDPATHQSAQFSSESEVRSWLDQRYYL